MDNNLPVDTTSENIEPKASKKKKLSFLNLSLIILVLIIVGGFGFYLLKGGSFISGNKGIPETIESSSESSVSEESPFSSLVGENSYPDDASGCNGECSGIGPSDIMKRSMFFLVMGKDISGEDLSESLLEGEVVVEVADNKDSLLCKIIALKNSSFNRQVGETIEFNFTADPEVTLIGRGSRIDYLPAIEDFKIPESLKIGDWIVFTCQEPSCDSGVLSWMLVLGN